MGEVITLKARPVPDDGDHRPIYICACGCQWFWLISDGQIQCCNCDEHQPLRTFDPDDPR